jgi:cytochrome bd-type quinol oxidase subunit 2
MHHATPSRPAADRKADATTLRTSRLLAGILGPALLVTTTTETANLNIWAQNSPTLTYLNGLVLFVAGLVVVRLRNRWERRWPVLVTSAGWLLVIAGLLRMAFPSADQPRDGVAAYLVIGSLLALGAVLTFLGYRPNAGVRA